MSHETGRVFLLGASGWLGQAIAYAIPEAIPLLNAEALDSDLTAADVVINAAGSKDPTRMQRSNVDLVARVIESTALAGTHIVHLGSAAEYGTRDAGERTNGIASLDEPTSNYGRTKLAATRLLQRSGRASVLRVFNVVANPPQPGSPLQDVLGRVESGLATGRPAEILSARTVRDWVSRDFVAEGVVAAVRRRPTGVFDICSGIPVSMADLVHAVLQRTGSEIGLVDLMQAPASTVVGDPTPWTLATGLVERMSAEAIAEVLVPRGGRSNEHRVRRQQSR